MSLGRITLTTSLLLLAGCLDWARPTNECHFNSQCDSPGRCESGSCRRDCRENIDCSDGWCDDLGYCQPFSDGDGDADTDADGDVEIDGDPDTESDLDTDDPTSGSYLDSCSSPDGCDFGCLPDLVWEPGYCTQECVEQEDCAFEHLCLETEASSACVDAHMGHECNPSEVEGNVCGWGCVGIAGGGAHCSRPCTTASDCPGGFACGFIDPDFPSTGKACMQVNIPCPTGNECPSGVGGFCGEGEGAGSWCTAPCETADDCPRLQEGIPPYECSLDAGLGHEVCQLTDAMLALVGENGIGSPCARNQDCRSGLCATDGSGLGPYCIEICTLQGGCSHGFGCAPLRTADSTFFLYCVNSGTGVVGSPCSGNADCRTAFCDLGVNRCSRVCNDGFCPSGFACVSSGIMANGTAIEVCR